MKFLVLEDDSLSRMALTSKLSKHGEITELSAFQESIHKSFDISFIDYDLGSEKSGIDFIKRHQGQLGQIFMLTGMEDPQVIRQAYLNGVDEYLVKPFHPNLIEEKLSALEQKRKLSKLLINLNKEFPTQNLSLQNLLKNCFSSILRGQSLLIEGETGTGKTQLAKIIAKYLFNGNMVNINCAEIADNLFESELFGHKKGSFTGAVEDKVGKIELADGGVLFLDEISSLSLEHQRKLLKVIEEKEYSRVGCNEKRKSNFFLISATCDNIQELTRLNKFREDLLYRINNVEITLPAIRHRVEDIELIMKSFLNTGKRLIFEPEAMLAIRKYSFPGNIREIKNLANQLQSRDVGIIGLEALPLKVFEKSSIHHHSMIGVISQGEEILHEQGLNAFTKFLEQEIVSQKLKENNSQVRKTINDLKISNSMFYRIQNSLGEELCR